MCAMIYSFLIFTLLHISKIDYIIGNINWMAWCQKSQSYKVQVKQAYLVGNTNKNTQLWN